MAINKTMSATRRRNVSPTSSILRTVTRDFDCSAFLVPPEDGQFIVTAGGDVASLGTSKVYHSATLTDVDRTGASLHMVWSSPLHSDRAALGDAKVPVLWHGGIEVELALYNFDNTAAIDASVNFAPGNKVTVGKNPSVVHAGPTGVSDLGSPTAANQRLCIEPLLAAEGGWAVGYVVSVEKPGTAGACRKRSSWRLVAGRLGFRPGSALLM